MPTNEDLAKERARATFNSADITSALYGKDGMHRRRLAFKRAAEDPEYANAVRFSTMDRDDVYDEAVRMEMVTALKSREYGYDEAKDSQSATDYANYLSAAFVGGHPFIIHGGGFIPSIKGQGTPEQIAEFIPKAECLDYIGTYCQTEIGHGSFVRGLETTATYDKYTQEFVMHTPRLSSLKFWPGGLGRSSNHVVMMAQLIIDGKEYGIHPFVCQLRDVDTHKPLPGVELGDINYKFGANVIDNGYLLLTQLRIPRTNMLMRYSQVLADGTYTREDVPPQVAYLSMTYLRNFIVYTCGGALAKASTIATRYSAVRRQTANSKGIEPQILDYQTQQMKLLPAVCTAYAILLASSALTDTYNEITTAVRNNDTSRLPELHCLTSALKASAADVSNHHIEVCRKACGGHGYSHASGIPAIFQANVMNCTVEGENTVLYLQVARSLMKFLRKTQAGEPVPSTMSFLSEPPVVPSHLKTAKAFSFEFYVTAFKLNALCMTRNIAGKMLQSTKTGSMDTESAFTAHSVGLVDTAKAYAQYLTAVLFIDVLTKKEWEPKAKKVMLQVCEFYLVYNLVGDGGTLLQNRILSSEQITGLRLRRTELLAELRPNAVTLVDAFDYPDRLLNSCLGRYDGNVYEALYEYAKSSSLNQHQIHPSYQKYIKPMQQAIRAKL